QSLLRGTMSPHPGEAVRLELQPDRGAVLALHRASLPLFIIPQQMLDMVTQFMRDDIGLREISRRAEALLQLLVEREVDVDLLIRRTIERSGGRLGKTTGRPHRIPEEYQLGRLVLATVGLQLAAPEGLGAVEHE